MVDDHPALRAGLTGLLSGESGIRCVGTAASSREVMVALGRRHVDVVVLDYAMGDRDGLSTCFSVKQRPAPPGVVLYTAYADRVFAVPATIAGADAVVSKSAPVAELLDAVIRTAGGDAHPPRLDPELVAAASARLLAEDLTVAGMLMGATPVERIAQILDLPVGTVQARAQRILGRLQAGHRTAAPADALAGVR